MCTFKCYYCYYYENFAAIIQQKFYDVDMMPTAFFIVSVDNCEKMSNTLWIALCIK